MAEEDVTVFFNPRCSKCRTVGGLLEERGIDRDALLDALVADPVLLERPIVVVGDRAVVARPPEGLLELLD